MDSALDVTDPIPGAAPAGVGLTSLQGIKTADELLRRAGGEQLLLLLRKLGFWVGAGRNPDEVVKTFPTELSKVESAELGDQSSYWQSEMSRVIAICGALESQRLIAAFEVKKRRDRGASRVLADHKLRTAEAVEAGEPKPRALTQAQINIEVSQRPEVLEAEEQKLLLDVVLTSLGAVKEAIEGYTRTLSREISRRGDLLRAGVSR